MPGEKTEKATPKKRRDARNKGQVRRSTEVNSTFATVLMLAMMMIIAPATLRNLMYLMHDSLSTSALSPIGYELDVNIAQGLFVAMMLRAGNILLPFFLLSIVSGLLINLIQVGFLFTTKPLKPELKKINPINGIKRMFSSRTVVELLKSIFKITVLGIIAYIGFLGMMDDFPTFIGRGLYESLMIIFNNAVTLGLTMCLAMLFISLADFRFQHWKHEKDLRMTKQEVKDEYKNMEGDPKIKGKIRQKQRQMSVMRMMSKVPEADVVITNPTHYAVALKYEDGAKSAPIVVAKGVDFVALKIRECAAEHHIEIVEDKPLAQALYNMCDIDDEIPADLYQAVADILVFVYRQKGKIKASS